MSSDSICKLRAKLSGMGLEVDCTVAVVRVKVPETGQVAYRHCIIEDAPPRLPDGDYTVDF